MHADHGQRVNRAGQKQRFPALTMGARDRCACPSPEPATMEGVKFASALILLLSLGSWVLALGEQSNLSCRATCAPHR